MFRGAFGAPAAGGGPQGASKRLPPWLRHCWTGLWDWARGIVQSLQSGCELLLRRAGPLRPHHA